MYVWECEKNDKGTKDEKGKAKEETGDFYGTDLWQVWVFECVTRS